jgi:type II secretory pathway pseudopilin PulG
LPTYPSPRLRLARRSAAARAGFSMLELMVTMGLATLLIGAGAGVYIKMGRRSAASQAINSIGQLVIRAKTASNRFPAVLSADAQAQQLHAYTDEVLQELHFEERPATENPWVPMGIEGRECKVQNARVEADSGRVGGGLHVTGGSVDCGTYAAYDVIEGINAEVWVRPTEPPKCDLVSRGRAFQVRLDTVGARYSRITVRIQVQDAAGAQESVKREVQIPPVRLNEWFGVRVSYDRTQLVTATSDGHGFVVRDAWKESRQLAREPEAALLVGAGLHGFLDDVRIGGVRSAEPLQLPAGVTFAGQNAPIHFAGGRLDPAYHTGPATISIAYEGVVNTFEIGPGGHILAVRQSDVPPAAPAPAEKAQPEPAKKE